VSGPRIGELFAGYGGLGMAVQAVLGGEIAWFSEFDKGPSKILAHRFPSIPNHGDITAIDWADVEPVDILTGGSPCQDLSHAGKRAGMTEGTRSNLWVAMREAIAQLRPGLVVWENVRGAYSAEADSALVDDPRLLADTRRRGGEPVLRALGRVLGDLSDLGYDARWHGLRAADVGAPHGRFRVFVVAYPNSAGRGEQWRPISARAEHASTQHAGSLLPTPRATDGTKGGPNQRGSSGDLMLPSAVQLLPTPAVNDMGAAYTPDEWDAWCEAQKAKHGNGNGHGKSLHIEAARLLPTPSVADSMGGHLTRSGDRSNELLLPGVAKEIANASTPESRSGEGLRDVRGTSDPQEVREWEARGPERVPQEEALLSEVREQPQGDPAGQSSLASAADRTAAGLPGVRDERAPARTSHRPESSEQYSGEPHHPLCIVPSAAALAGGSGLACGCNTNWGQYEAAIRRWERVLGRCAPAPTQLGPKGRPRLDARFSEFMMGLPAGWVTDIPGITRNEALKALGNGVVPQQGAEALRQMLAWSEAAA